MCVNNLPKVVAWKCKAGSRTRLICMRGNEWRRVGGGNAVCRVRAYAHRPLRGGRAWISRLFVQRPVTSGPQVLRTPVVYDQHSRQRLRCDATVQQGSQGLSGGRLRLQTRQVSVSTCRVWRILINNYQLSLIDPRDGIVLDDHCGKLPWSSVGAPGVLST